MSRNIRSPSVSNLDSKPPPEKVETDIFHILDQFLSRKLQISDSCQKGQQNSKNEERPMGCKKADKGKGAKSKAAKDGPESMPIPVTSNNDKHINSTTIM